MAIALLPSALPNVFLMARIKTGKPIIRASLTVLAHASAGVDKRRRGTHITIGLIHILHILISFIEF